MTGLPPDLHRHIDDIVQASGLTGPVAREARDDLEQHAMDALEAGLSIDDVRRRLGDPESVAPALAGSSRPRLDRPDPRAGEPWIPSLISDVRFGLRALVRSPTGAVTATLVLALGIGANAVVFTVVNELLLRPLPVAHQESLVDVWADVSGGNSFLGFGWQDYVQFRDGAEPLEALAAFAGMRVTIGDAAGGAAAVASLVSPEYPDLLGLRPSLGTMEFPPGQGFGSAPIAVVSHDFWRNRLGGDPGVLGQALRVDGRAVTVIGVGPEGFRGHFIGFPVDLWMPVTAAVPFLAGFDPDDRVSMPFELIGRLRPGASPEEARAALNAIAGRLASTFPESHRGRGVGVTRTTGLDHSLQGPVTAFLAVLTVVSSLVLLIACLNVGGVLLVRTLAREREMAIRLALGAGNGRLVRQLSAESLVLSLLGAGAGVLLAVLLNGWLAGLLRAQTSGLGLELALDARVLGLTALAAVAAAAMAVVAPTIHLLRKAPASVLSARGDTVWKGRGRAVLVLGQVAISVALVIATGLFIRALTEGLRADPGFDPDRVAAFTLESGATSEMDPAARTVVEAVLRDLEAIPGVEAASFADAAPLGVARSPLRIQVPGLQPPAGEDAWVVDGRRVWGGWLETVGISLVSGRGITPEDAGQGPQVAVVNQAFARRFWPDQEAVGRSFDTVEGPVAIVGVATDVQYLLQDLNPDPIVYLSLAGAIPSVPRFVIRGSRPEARTAELREVVARHLPEHTPPVLVTPRQSLDGALLPQRLGATVVGGMGLAALFLAAVGLYGLVQFTVARQSHELAVRRALGGSRASILKIVLRRALVLVGVGVALGVLLAAGAARGLSAFLLGVSPTDPLTYAVVAALFGSVALLASWLPAHRAAQIEPARALRGDQ